MLLERIVCFVQTRFSRANTLWKDGVQMFKNRSISSKNKTEQYGEAISTGSTTLTRTIGTQLVIKIFGEIPEPDHPSIHEIFEQLVDPTVSEIDIIINTYGGSWNTGIMLYNMLM